MANDDHVAWVRQGDKQQIAHFESGGALDLSGADLSGSNLANLHLVGADLSGAIFTGSILHRAVFQGCKMPHADFGGADLSNATIEGCDCTGADFSQMDGRSTSLSAAQCPNAKFHDAILVQVDMSRAIFNGTEFTRANLTRAKLHNAGSECASFDSANLTGAALNRGAFRSSRFDRADITGTDFFEADLRNSSFEGTTNARLARNLHTVTQLPPYNFHECKRDFAEKWVDWERIRAFGRLPLFGASYTALLVTVAYISVLSFYNERIDAARELADKAADAAQHLPETAANSVERLAATAKEKLHRQPPTGQAGLILASTILLAAASTIYSIWCPPEVRDFSSVQWCHELNKWLVHYWAHSWKFRGLRITCASLYVAGALLALWIILGKVCWAAYYLATWRS